MIYFVSGLPRSGSTLLLNILGQNPRHHVTATNDLIELIVGIRNTWMNFEGFKAQGLDNIKPRILSMMARMLYGFYENEHPKIIFDKSRGWIAYIELLEEIFEQKVKVIVTIRDIRSIVASFEKLYRKSQLTQHTVPMQAYFNQQSILGRAQNLLSAEAVVGLAVNRLKDAIDRGLQDRLIIIKYRDLVTNMQETLNDLHSNLNLPNFTYSENIEQITQEDDSIYGLNLHKISSQLTYQPEPWKGILNHETLSWLEQNYNGLCF